MVCDKEMREWGDKKKEDVDVWEGPRRGVRWLRDHEGRRSPFTYRANTERGGEGVKGGRRGEGCEGGEGVSTLAVPRTLRGRRRQEAVSLDESASLGQPGIPVKAFRKGNWPRDPKPGQNTCREWSTIIHKCRGR